MNYQIINSFINKLDPELAHSLAIQFLKNLYIPLFPSKDDEILKINILGNEFLNPIGLAAGFDKNAEVYDKMFALGFGFAEVGTITPKAQEGNSKPRVFRLIEDEAIINRLGFPSGMNTAPVSSPNDVKNFLRFISIKFFLVLPVGIPR